MSFTVRGATVLDGTGGEPFVTNVVVEGDRIRHVGDRVEGEVIDGDGLFLAPGFIDCHCHDDLAALREPDRPEKVAQGVTTAVVGNCGFSLFPHGDLPSELRAHAGGLLGDVSVDEVFRDLAGYRDALASRGMAINLVPLVGHGPLRLMEMGYDATPASVESIERMCGRLARQLDQGGAGLSLGLVYPPSAFADRRELVELCRCAARRGKPVAAHIRGYEATLPQSTAEFLDILAESRARGVLSHLQAAGRPNWGLVARALEAMEAARAGGVDVVCDMYPYVAGSSYALQLLPPSELAGGVQALKARLRDPSYRKSLRARLLDPCEDESGWQSKVSLIGWESILIAGSSLRVYEGQTLAEAGKDTDPFEVLVRLIEEDDGATAVILFQLSEDDLRTVFDSPLSMVGSDGIPRFKGRPHPRGYGAFPRVWDRLTKQSGWLTPASATAKMTSRAASVFGLKHRGVIREGAIADLALFEPGFCDRATFESPRALATGMRDVWVAGTAVLRDGVATGARPGAVLGQLSAPSADPKRYGGISRPQS